MVNVNAIKQVELKLQRAKKHFADLQVATDAFLQTQPYRVACKKDSETRRPVYFVEAAEPVPDDIALITGDAIQNLASTLDHLAFQLVLRDTNGNPPTLHRVYFPIGDDKPSYDAEKNKKLPGASKATKHEIDLIQPYRTANECLWALHKINNIEKHRLLVTVGSQAGGLHLGQAMLAGPEAQTLSAAMRKMMETTNLYLNPEDKGFPLQPGFELYRGLPDEQPNECQRFRFEIVLNEPGIVEGKLLIRTIGDMVKEVESVMQRLIIRL